MPATITPPVAAPVVVRKNWYPNPMNSGTPSDGLAPGNSAYSLAATTTHTYSVVEGWQRIRVTAFSTPGRRGITRSFDILASSGDVVSMACRLWAVTLPSGVSARVRMDLHEGATVLDSVSVLATAAGDVQAEIKASGTATSVRFYVWLETDAATSSLSSIDFKWATVTVNASAVPPFYGNAPSEGDLSYSWEGVSQNSPSLEWLTDTAALAPRLLTSYETARRSDNRVHEILGGGIAVSFGAAARLRTGTLELLFTDEDSAHHAELAFARPGVFTLAYPERPTVAMRFVVAQDGEIRRELTDSRQSWMVRTEFQEVPL